MYTQLLYTCKYVYIYICVCVYTTYIDIDNPLESSTNCLWKCPGDFQAHFPERPCGSPLHSGVRWGSELIRAWKYVQATIKSLLITIHHYFSYIPPVILSFFFLNLTDVFPGVVNILATIPALLVVDRCGRTFLMKGSALGHLAPHGQRGSWVG